TVVAELQVTFEYAGSAQEWVVPEGVTSVLVEVWGAQGGTPDVGAEGGLGGYAVGTLAVTPAETLYVYVGEQGRIVSGSGGGGGGASDIRRGGTALANRVIVGGGGGGGGLTTGRVASGGAG